MQTSTPMRHGLESARPALEADFETALQSNLDSEQGAATEPSSHLWPPVPQEGAEPADALDAFVPLAAGGGTGVAVRLRQEALGPLPGGGKSGATAADEIFAAAFEKYCASEASPGDVRPTSSVASLACRAAEHGGSAGQVRGSAAAAADVHRVPAALG